MAWHDVFRFFLYFCVLCFFSSAAFAAVPSISSPTHPNGQWASAPSILVSVEFSGAAGFIYSVDRNPETIPDEASATAVTSGRNIGLGSKSDGEYWFHVRAKTDSGLSETAHWHIKVDNSSPLRPENALGIAKEDGAVYLEWSEPNDISGIVGYTVYRSIYRWVKDTQIGIMKDFTPKDVGVVTVADKTTALSITDSNILVGKGRPYFYRIQAFDSAGNPGALTGIITVRTASLCELAFSILPSLSDGNLSIEVSSDGEFKQGHLVVEGPDNVPLVLIESLSNSSFASASFPLAGMHNGDYNISFSGKDGEGDLCSAQKIFAYDTVAPSVKIVSPEESVVLSGMVNFAADASDSGENPSGISSVSVFVKLPSGESKACDLSLQSGNYSCDWNSSGIENGRFIFFLRAFDKGGNKAESMLTYSVLNTGALISSASSAISSAESKRKDALDYFIALKKKNAFSGDLNTVFLVADSNLAYAKELFSNSKFFDLSVASARSAEAAYAAAKAGVSSEVYGSRNYSYNQSQLEVFLKSTGIDSANVAEAKALVKKHSPSRRLEVLKVTKDGNVSYRANIVVSFAEVDRNKASFSVVEVIPKAFAKSADDISSQAAFEILENDPVIVFRGISADGNSGQGAELVYFLNQDLNVSQASGILDLNLMDSFVSPPVLLNSDSKVNYSPKVDLPLPALPKIDKKTAIIGGVLLFVFLFFCALGVVGIVLVWYFFFRKKSSGTGNGLAGSGGPGGVRLGGSRLGNSPRAGSGKRRGSFG